jgi:hypothetical protein
MKKLLLLAIPLMFLMSSCAKWMQVVSVEGVNAKLKNDTYYFENDTVLVSYYFWAERGVMSFTIYNKLNVPLYIDWKKSSLISNSSKINYWEDEEYTNSRTNYQASNYSFMEGLFRPLITLPGTGSAASYGQIFNAGIGVTVGESYTNSTKTRPERITFLPPRSNFFRTTKHLTDFTYVAYNPGNFVEQTVPASYKAGKQSKILVAELKGQNVFLTFRNFLAISTSENFASEFYVDNEFKVKTVTLMKADQYSGKLNTTTGEWELPYRRATNFFYDYPFRVKLK